MRDAVTVDQGDPEKVTQVVGGESKVNRLPVGLDREVDLPAPKRRQRRSEAEPTAHLCSKGAARSAQFRVSR